MPKYVPITGTPTPEIEQRFWSKVEKQGRCMVWNAASRPSGGNLYGVFKFSPEDAKPRNVGAHRFSLYMHLGRDPGETVHHRCFNTLCVDPGHLEADASKAENNQQQLKNLSAFCKKGHRRTEENTYINPGTNARQCRDCLRERDRERYAEKYEKEKQQQTNSSDTANGKLDENKVAAIRALYKIGWSQRKLAREFEVSQPLIGQIVRGEIWKKEDE